MSGAHALDELIASMRPELVPGVYVFVTLDGGGMPDGLVPRMMFEEAEGTTLICLKTAAVAHGMAFEFPCRMITLNIHSSLEAVGFLARVTRHLAKLDLPVNPVSGFYHDHLFVPEARAMDALAALEALSGEASDPTP